MNTRTLPVWLYWEGPCPEWIAACQRTILQHAPGAILLDPRSFADLWDRDRDIDIDRWHVAHRADFVRAFLLARHGGLWIDSDCVLLRPLDDLLERVAHADFVAHRERSGMVSNGFIAAPPGSRIAAELYRRICQALRTRQTLDWTDLGGTPLTQILSDPPGAWLQLPCRLIQPICWSETAELFRTGTPAEHAARFDGEALCYMLSNQQVGYHRERYPEADLLATGTFFRYLVARASGLEEQADADPVAVAAPAPGPTADTAADAADATELATAATAATAVTCARVAFHETMGYSIDRLRSGASSHNNDARPFRDVPAALAGKVFTQLVSGRVSPVEIEFLSPGKLFVLAGTDWDGGRRMIHLLEAIAQAEDLPPLVTERDTAFQPFSITGAAGDHLVLPTQVMLVADDLTRLGEGHDATGAGQARQAPVPAARRRTPRVLVIAAQPAPQPLAPLFDVLDHLRWADAGGFVPVVYFNRRSGVWSDATDDPPANAWERLFLPVSTLGFGQLVPDPAALADLDAAELARTLSGRAIVRDRCAASEAGASRRTMVHERQRANAARLAARYLHVRPELRTRADHRLAHRASGRFLLGVDGSRHAAGVLAAGRAALFETYRPEIERQIARHPDLGICVCSDSDCFLETTEQAYGDRVVHREGGAAESGLPAGAASARDAEAALGAALVLARCHHLVHGASDTAAAALVLNGTLSHSDLRGGPGRASHAPEAS